MISTGAEYPRLFRVPADIKDTELVDNLVTFEDFDWDNKGILHQIVVDCSVEYVDMAFWGWLGGLWLTVVRAGGE